MSNDGYRVEIGEHVLVGCIMLNFLHLPVLTLVYLLNIGNNANHSTANDINPNTCKLEGSLDAKSTEANIAALTETDPGNLINPQSILTS